MSTPEIHNETLLVTVRDEDLHRISDIAKSLEKAGLRVEDVGEATGVISGSGPRALISSLVDVAGVEAVEVSRKVGASPRA